MALDPAGTAVVVGLVAGLVALMVLEVKFLRRRAAEREERQDLPDRAHTAVATTRAIAVTLARGGVRSPEADALLREADLAYRGRNYRVSMDLADRARSVLQREKARQREVGDLAKLATLPGSSEPTTKERLQQDYPEHFLESRFALRLAQEAIDRGRGEAQDVAAAEGYLADAQVAFDGERYAEALHYAVLSRKAAEGAVVDGEPATRPAVEEGGGGCPSCGLPVDAEDAFCRRCGAPLDGGGASKP